LAPRDRGVLRKEHGDLARVLVDSGVDVLLCETFAAPYEAVAAVEACVATGVETWIALTAGPLADLLSPRELGEAARACVDAGARAALVNCVDAPKTGAYVDALAEALEGGAPFGAYANAGPPERVSPARYAELAGGWIARGATLVGACCYASPAHVAAIAALAR
jgi:S-methylmethionine-dependent homocysteine/selenocysteine methylase